MELKSFASKVYRGLDTPVSRACNKALQDERWDDLLAQRIDPRSYSSALSYWCDAQALALLKKCRDLPTGVNLASMAKETFDEGEQACKRTNIRLLPYLGNKAGEFDPDVAMHLHGVRKIVRSILGKFSWDDVEPAFGPGATYSDRSPKSTIGDKMNSVPSITSAALERVFPHWELTHWGRACLARSTWHYPCVVPGNRFATAPKDATKDRPIGAEPSINVFYQLGIGRMIRRRLRGVGIDLNTGQKRHKQVACAASLSGLDMTLDLKNASGTLSKNLVRFLIPSYWLAALEAVRSPKMRFNAVRGDGRWLVLEQYSSMGNGFTFELETLIFYAITKYVSDLLGSKRDVMVYGDDIIADRTIASALIPFLAFCGFETNKEKSFVDGPFRESCGGDYFEGIDVRPYYMKELPHEPQHLISVANGIRASTKTISSREDCLRAARFFVIDHLPTAVRGCRGPEGLGDLVLHEDEDRWRRDTRRKSGIRYVRVYRPVSRGYWPRTPKGRVPWLLFDSDVVHACATYGVSDNRLTLSRLACSASDHQIRVIHDGGLTPRGGVTGYKVGWVAYS